jgi:hypothetical protein
MCQVIWLAWLTRNKQLDRLQQSSIEAVLDKAFGLMM